MKTAHTSLVLTALFIATSALDASAQCTTPDVLEPNDSCSTATAITPGLITGLTVTGSFVGQASPDFFTIDVPNGERILAEVYHDWAEDEDLSLYLYDGAQTTCGDQFHLLAEGFTWTDNEAVSWTNTTGATVSCVVEVAAWDLGVQPTACDDYALRVDVGVADCVLGVDDAFEPNDSCAAAVVLAPGFHTDLVTSPTSSDFYRVDLAAGERLNADLLYGEEGQDGLILELYDSPSCVSRVDSSALGGTNTVTWANSGNLTVQTTVVVRTANPGSCNEYSLQVATGPDPCLASADDSLEPNDTCATSAPLTAGMQTGRFVSVFSPDYYRITVPAGQRLIADVTYALANGALIAEIYSDAACTVLADSVGWTGADQVQYANPTGAPLDLYVVVRVATPGSENCNSYDLDLSIVPDGCLSQPDDGFEPNDDCASAVLLAPGTYAANYVHKADADYYAADVAPGERLTIDVLYTATAGPLDVVLYSDLGCAVAVDAASASGGDRVIYTNTSAATVRCIAAIQVPAWTMQDCNNYDLSVNLVPEPCLLAADDAFEENDSCSSPYAIAQGTHIGRFVSGVDEDYYRVSVAPNDRLTVDIFYGTPAASALSLALYDDTSCTNLVDFESWTGADSVSFANAGPTTADWTIVVSAADTVASECNSYDITVSMSPDPCLTATDDPFEDNDDCTTATPLAAGQLTGLFASFDDNDFFTFDLIPGGAVVLELDHNSSTGDLDLLLFDIGPGCGAQFFEVASATTAASHEVLAYKNTAGSTVTYALQVTPWDVGVCNTYDLTTTFTDNQVGTPTCMGDGSFDPGTGLTACPCSNLSAVGSGEGCVNSTGVGAILEARGTSVFANDDLAFELSQARPNQPSMLVQGSSLIGLPFKDGILCVGNPTERIEVVFLDASGSGSTSGSIATSGAIPGPGTTRYYQQWYRDPDGISPCGTGSNFSNGVMVTWD